MSDKKATVQYLAGAGDDGYGFFPVITCSTTTSQGKKRVRWVLYHPREQYRDKEEALQAADVRIEAVFEDHQDIFNSPDRFGAYLRALGFTDIKSYITAQSFDQNRQSALGDAYQPALGDAAVANDPELHAQIMGIVDTQIAENQPPETRRTLERLINTGHSPELAKRLIGLCVACELVQEYVLGKPFNEEEYTANLQKLPEPPEAPPIIGIKVKMP
jgi:hypothetical protein